VVDLANARPTLTLSGGQNMISALTNAQAVGTGITATISSVFRTNTGVNQSLISGNGNEYNIHAPWSDGNTYYDVSNPGQGRIQGQLNWSALSVASFLRNGAIAQVYKNGVNSLNSNSRNTSFTFSNSNIFLFSFSNNSTYTQGIVPEMILFSTALSTSDRQIIELDQTCYYNIVNPLFTPSVTAAITTGSNPTCGGTSITFTATPTNGGASPSYQWTKNGLNISGATAVTYTGVAGTDFANGDLIRVVLTNNSTCAITTATSSAINMTVNPVFVPAVSAAITTGTNPTCNGTSITFTATPTNGGASPTYQWTKNGTNISGATAVTYTGVAGSDFVNGDLIRVVLTSNATCASPTTVTSTAIAMTVNSTVTPSVALAITAGSNPSCAGSSVTFTATPTNGGSSPSYDFRVNGSSVQNSASDTYTTSSLTNGQTVEVIMTSNAGCALPLTANSSIITMTVDPGLIPTITITETQFNLCSGGIDFSSVVTNEGVSPSYQWKLNGVDIPGEINSILIQSGLIDGDIITCELTSSLACVSGATVLSNAINVDLTGSQSTWLGLSNVWNAPSNWSNGVPNSSVSVIIPAGTPFSPAALAPAFAYDLTINPGATLEISGSSVLGIYGNFTNNGTFIPNTGTLSFLNCNGTGPTIHTLGSGTGVETNFFNLTLNDASGLILGENISVDATLAITNGNFNAGTKVVTLNSTAARTGRIGQLLVGTFTGNIIQKRYMPGPTTGWALLGTSVTNANIAQWTDDFPTSGFIGSTGWAGGFISIYHYDEAPGGLFDAVASYVPITNATNAVVNGKGYWVYLGTALNTTADITSDVTGTPAMGTINLGITYTDSGNPTEDGWNLIANPYPSTVDWEAAGWTKTNIDGAVYIYQADNQQYATYVGGVGTNGGTRFIENSQGFYVKANSLSPALIGTETVKVNQTATFIRTTDPENVLRLTLSSNDLSDEAIIRFDNNATLDFDQNLDGVKRFSKQANYPSLGVVSNNQNLSICALPKGMNEVTLPLMTGSSTAGNYTLSWKINNRFEEAYCMTLEDLVTGAKIDMKTNFSYSFELAEGIQNRLVIHSTHSLPTRIEHPNCTENSLGRITIVNNNNNEAVVELRTENGTTLEKVSFSNSEYTFENLKPGLYHLNFENKGVCGNLIQEIFISGENYTNASLSTNVESVDLNISESIELTPSPENGSIISIDFGDGVRLEGISQKESIQHQYKSEGNFTIRIVSVNGNCSDAKEIPVSVSNNELFAVKQLDNELQLLYNFENPTNVEMQIVNSLGAIVFESNLNGLKTGKQNLSIANYKPGVYFVSFSYDQKMVTRKIVK
jgi:hypothetical protein